ncbi:MAG: hypothetical protein WC848_01615 [Parcubacteria group bacterium]|jgi:FixJ family two-component response regulator
MKNTIVIVEDIKSIRDGWQKVLNSNGFEVVELESVADWRSQTLTTEKIAGAILDFCIIGGNTIEIADYLKSRNILFVAASSDSDCNIELARRGALKSALKKEAAEVLVAALAVSELERERVRKDTLAEISLIDERNHQTQVRRAERVDALERAFESCESPDFRVDVSEGEHEVLCVSLYPVDIDPPSFLEVAWHVPLRGSVRKEGDFLFVADRRIRIKGSRKGLEGENNAISIWLKKYNKNRPSDYYLAVLYLSNGEGKDDKEQLRRYEKRWEARGVGVLPLSAMFE